MPHATAAPRLNDDTDVLDMARQFGRERKTKLMLVIGILVTLLAGGFVATLLTYSSL